MMSGMERKKALRDLDSKDVKSNGAFEIQDKEKWYGEQVEAKSDPLVDSGTGKLIMLRQFEFAFKPGMKEKPNKQQLFNQAWPMIRPLLWSDGFVASNDVDPRVIVGKKGYKIILLCEPRLRRVVHDTAKTLQQVLSKKP